MLNLCWISVEFENITPNGFVEFNSVEFVLTFCWFLHEFLLNLCRNSVEYEVLSPFVLNLRLSLSLSISAMIGLYVVFSFPYGGDTCYFGLVLILYMLLDFRTGFQSQVLDSTVRF